MRVLCKKTPNYVFINKTVLLPKSMKYGEFRRMRKIKHNHANFNTHIREKVQPYNRLRSNEKFKIAHLYTTYSSASQPLGR